MSEKWVECRTSAPEFYDFLYSGLLTCPGKKITDIRAKQYVEKIFDLIGYDSGTYLDKILQEMQGGEYNAIGKSVKTRAGDYAGVLEWFMLARDESSEDERREKANALIERTPYEVLELIKGALNDGELKPVIYVCKRLTWNDKHSVFMEEEIKEDE